MPEDGLALVDAVDAAVPHNLPPDVREEACQDMILAVLEGRESVESLRSGARAFIRAAAARYPNRYSGISLDSSMRSGSPFGELLASDGRMAWAPTIRRHRSVPRRPDPEFPCPECGVLWTGRSPARQFRTLWKLCPSCYASETHSIRELLSAEAPLDADLLSESFWPTDRCYKELVPLLLYRGSWSIGRAQACWNLARVLMALNVTRKGVAKELLRREPRLYHAAGFHDISVYDPSLPLVPLVRRVLGSGAARRIDPMMTGYLGDFERDSRLAPIRIDPIPAWSRRGWRRTGAPAS